MPFSNHNKSIPLVINKRRLTTAIAMPALIFLACTLITYTSKFREHPDKISLAIALDLLITAPLAYYLVIRKSALSKISVLRVFLAGVLVAGGLLSKSNLWVLSIIRNWVYPSLEITLIGFIVWKFYVADKGVKTTQGQRPDFLVHCRAVLQLILGSEKLGNVLASEIAVFYYVFRKRSKIVDYKEKFTSYKENGSMLVLSTFLVLFLIETAGMHLLFMLWNNIAAWVFTGLSLYTCLQLFAHIRALKARPITIENNVLLFRNGLMGGDAIVSVENIEKMEMTGKDVTGKNVVKLALVKGLENHNFAVYLHHPVVVIKAFGIKKIAKVILVSIDRPKDFIKVFETLKNGNVITKAASL